MDGPGPHGQDKVANCGQPPYAYANPVMNQPMPAQMHNQVNVTIQGPAPTRNAELHDWNSGLCSCCEDVSSCLCIWLCAPCYICCSLSPRMGEHCCTPVCLSLVEPCMFLPILLFRTKLRSKYNIKGSMINDCCCSVCCGALVACQIKRELDFLEDTIGTAPFPIRG